MRLASVVFAGAILMGAAPAFAGAHSDYTKSFPLQTLQTFEFRTQQRISRDPLANNSIWSENIRDDIRTGLMSRGLTEVSAKDMPDFYVTYYVAVANRYNLNAIGFHRGWWGWPGTYAVSAVPYTESTLMVDVIDAHTNQLVWRGYDSDTLNTNKPDKTIDKAVNNVVSQFFHDVKDQRG
jgi:hypothetical protein